MSATGIAPRCKQLWMVGGIFDSMKPLLETRPVRHERDEAIRGHVFRPFSSSSTTCAPACR
jgi:hypothetical protein